MLPSGKTVEKAKCEKVGQLKEKLNMYVLILLIISVMQQNVEINKMQKEK